MENSFFEFNSDYPIILEECKTPSQNKIFRDTINKYHSYKKYTDSPTRNIRWLVYEKTGNQVGVIGLSSATIAVKVRDDFIGWNNSTKIKNLGMLANNSRFCLVKERFTIKNIGSMTLKRLEIDGSKLWKEKYNQDLILLETFVEPSSDRIGCVYKASNWIELGLTSGASFKKCPLLLWQKESGERGKIARENPKLAMEIYGNYEGRKYIVTQSKQKIMFVKPLIKNWKEKLLQ